MCKIGRKDTISNTFSKDFVILPFLKPRRETGLIIRTRKPDGTSPESHSSDSDNPGLLAAAEDLCKGLEAKDYDRVAKAFRAAFDILESEPHDEAPETVDETEKEPE